MKKTFLLLALVLMTIAVQADDVALTASFRDALTGNEYLLPENAKVETFKNELCKCNVQMPNTYLSIFSKKHPKKDYYSKKELMGILEGYNFGTLYRVDKVEHPHQSGEHRYYNYVNAKGDSIIVCVTLLPGHKTVTYIIEDARDEASILSPSIVQTATFKYWLYKNHTVGMSNWVFVILLFVIGILAGGAYKLFGIRDSNPSAKALSIIVSILAFAGITFWYLYVETSVLAALIYGLLTGAVTLSITYPNGEVRSTVMSFVKGVIDNA